MVWSFKYNLRTSLSLNPYNSRNVIVDILLPLILKRSKVNIFLKRLTETEIFFLPRLDYDLMIIKSKLNETKIDWLNYL